MSEHVNPIDKMFEYNLWANVKLIELCRTLSEEQLQVEVEGVYGRIQTTLAHLVGAEGGYLSRLTGKRPWADDLDIDSMPLDELLDLAKISGAKLIEVASQVDAAKQHDIIAPWGAPFKFFNWTVILQALYHGIEHRTQVKSMLTKLGVEHPELAAWDYTETLQ